jgi:N-acetylmuramoyl-L-alanine amidase
MNYTPWKRAMVAANAKLAKEGKGVSVPRNFNYKNIWGDAAKTFAERLHKAYGLPVNARLDAALQRKLEPFMPELYSNLSREVFIAAGHAGFYNKMPALPAGYESKEAIRVAHELVKECVRRGARHVHLVPDSMDLSASVNYVLSSAPKGSNCWELHYNAGPANVRGWLTTYSTGNRASLAMAQEIARQVREAGFPLWGSGILPSSTIAKWNGYSSGDIGWHRSPNQHGLVPNLIEMGFGTSNYDTSWWKAASRRKLLISAMADALYPPAR